MIGSDTDHDTGIELLKAKELASASHPNTYRAMKRNLETAGWVYDTNTDRWYNMAAKKTLCLDFDGVIHSYTSGWQGHATIEDPPVPGAIEFMYDALKTFKVAIYSSRSSSPAGIDAMRAYIELHCKAAGFDYGQPWWLQLEWPINKPSAWVTIDDRAITFTGVWPSMAELVNFKPWFLTPEFAQTALGQAVTLLKEEKV